MDPASDCDTKGFNYQGRFSSCAIIKGCQNSQEFGMRNNSTASTLTAHLPAGKAQIQAGNPACSGIEGKKPSR